MDKNLLKARLDRLRLYYLKNNIDFILHKSQIDGLTNMEFLEELLLAEINNRDKKDFDRRYKAAHISGNHNLENFDYDFGGISKLQLKQLRELIWVENTYNLILMGPSGTGKTYIASGLIYEAVKKGYRAHMYTMQELMDIIRFKNISLAATSRYNQVIRAHLIAIDDIMLMPINKEEATAFFNLINTLHEKTSIIITTNKAPTKWGETLNDEIVTTAILDRILYKCEVIKLTGASYRIENRKTIFKEI